MVGWLVVWKSENGIFGHSLHLAVYRVDDQQIASQAGMKARVAANASVEWEADTADQVTKPR
jgi:hypothetical protein